MTPATPDLAPLAQSASISTPLECGAAMIYECSNSAATHPIPRLRLLQPHLPGYGDGPGTPANSMDLGENGARQLYEFLHSYYQRSGKALSS